MKAFLIPSLLAAGFPATESGEDTFALDDLRDNRDIENIEKILDQQLPFTLAAHRSHASHSSHGSHRSSSGGGTYVAPTSRNTTSVPPTSILPSSPALPSLNGTSAAFIEMVRRVQLALYVLGYYTGAIDGLAGPQTIAAIAKYQSDAGLPITGKMNDALIKALNVPLD